MITFTIFAFLACCGQAKKVLGGYRIPLDLKNAITSSMTVLLCGSSWPTKKPKHV